MKTLVVSLALLAGAQEPSPIVKIVSSLPRTGGAKALSDAIVNGIVLALEEARYTAGPFRVTYADLDDATALEGKWTAEKESANADLAIHDPDVMVYIGTYNSGAAKVSMPRLNAARMLMVSPAASWPGLTKPGQGDAGEPEKYRPSGLVNFVRVVPADDIQGVAAAEWAKTMGLRRTYVLDDREVYGRGIAELFRQRCEELGITVVGHEGIDPKAQEFRSLMTKVKAAAPDLVYFGGTPQTKAGQIAKDAVAVGVSARLMFPDACYESSFVEAAGAVNLNGRAFLTFGGLPPEKHTGQGRRFVEAYVKKHGKTPESYAIYGYESARVALEAIHRAGKKDRDAIRAAGVSIRKFDGALGLWSFDKNGDTTLRTMTGLAVVGGKFEFSALLNDE